MGELLFDMETFIELVYKYHGQNGSLTIERARESIHNHIALQAPRFSPSLARLVTAARQKADVLVSVRRRRPSRRT